MPHTPSPYQQRFLDWLLDETGDAYGDAVAGSGKTSTALLCANALTVPQRSRAAYVAFSKALQAEIEPRLPDGMRSFTVHKLGLQIVNASVHKLGAQITIDEHKYRKLFRFWLESQGVDPDSLTDEEQLQLEAMDDLRRFCQVTLTDMSDDAAIMATADLYNVEIDEETWGRALDGVRTVLRWGLEGLTISGEEHKRYGANDCISFDDMIYLPNVLPGAKAPRQYDFLITDEFQDLSRAQYGVVSMYRAPGGRVLWIGDERQAIFGFAGADYRSVRFITETTKAKKLSLPVCYRCPTSHIALAQEIVPHIQAAPGAIQGEIWQVPYTSVAAFVTKGDLILSRTTAPAVQMCYALIRAGINAQVKGREVGKGLVKLVKDVAKLKGFAFEQFLTFLDEYQTKKTRQLDQRENSENKKQQLADKCEAASVLYSDMVPQVCDTIDGFIAKIEEMFASEHADVMLCTAHRAKGLEAERILILRWDLFPHPMAEGPDAILQEMNLKYVAVTRAKKCLGFILAPGQVGDLAMLSTAPVILAPSRSSDPPPLIAPTPVPPTPAPTRFPEATPAMPTQSVRVLWAPTAEDLAAHRQARDVICRKAQDADNLRARGEDRAAIRLYREAYVLADKIASLYEPNPDTEPLRSTWLALTADLAVDAQMPANARLLYGQALLSCPEEKREALEAKLVSLATPQEPRFVSEPIRSRSSRQPAPELQECLPL